MRIRKLHIGYIISKGLDVADALGVNYYYGRDGTETSWDDQINLSKKESKIAEEHGLSREESKKWVTTQAQYHNK